MSTAGFAAGARARVAELISEATDGEIGAAGILAAEGSLVELGVGSLAVLRLADALEEEFGLVLDLGGPEFRSESLDSLAARIPGTETG